MSRRHLDSFFDRVHAASSAIPGRVGLSKLGAAVDSIIVSSSSNLVDTHSHEAPVRRSSIAILSSIFNTNASDSVDLPPPSFELRTTPVPTIVAPEAGPPPPSVSSPVIARRKRRATIREGEVMGATPSSPPIASPLSSASAAAAVVVGVRQATSPTPASEASEGRGTPSSPATSTKRRFATSKVQYALDTVAGSTSMLGYIGYLYGNSRFLVALRVILARVVYHPFVQLVAAGVILFGSAVLASIIATGNSLTDPSFDRTRAIFGVLNVCLAVEAVLRALIAPGAGSVLDAVTACLVVAMHREGITAALLIRLPRGLGPISNFPVLQSILLPFLRIVQGLGALGRSLLFFLFFFFFLAMGMVISFFRSMHRRCLLVDPEAAIPPRSVYLPPYRGVFGDGLNASDFPPLASAPPPPYDARFTQSAAARSGWVLSGGLNASPAPVPYGAVGPPEDYYGALRQSTVKPSSPGGAGASSPPPPSPPSSSAGAGRQLPKVPITVTPTKAGFLEAIPPLPCALPDEQGYHCGDGFACISDVDGPQFGLETFDYLTNAMLTLWHVISLSAWGTIVTALGSTENPVVAPVTILIAYFLLKVILSQLFIASALSLLVDETSRVRDADERAKSRTLRLLDPYGRPTVDPFDAVGRLGVSGPPATPLSAVSGPDGALLETSAVVEAAKAKAELESEASDGGDADPAASEARRRRASFRKLRSRGSRSRAGTRTAADAEDREAKKRSCDAIPKIISAFESLQRPITPLEIAYAVQAWLDVRLEQFAAARKIKASQLGRSFMETGLSNGDGPSTGAARGDQPRRGLAIGGFGDLQGQKSSTTAFGELTGGTYTDTFFDAFSAQSLGQDLMADDQTTNEGVKSPDHNPTTLRGILCPELPPVVGDRWTVDWARSVHARVGAIVVSTPFEVFVSLAVIINVAVLATFHVGMSREQAVFLEWVENGFLVLYTIEQVLKLFFYPDGLRGFWQLKWNRFDLLLVSSSWLSVAVTYTSGFDFAGSASLRSIRSVRLLRVLRNLRVLRLISTLQAIQVKAFLRIHELNHLIICCGKTLLSLTPLLALVWGMIATLAIITTSYLHGKLPLTPAEMDANDPLRQGAQERLLYFDSIWRSLLVFVVHITEDQRFQFVNASLHYAGWASLLIFVPSYILLNFLFPAILTARVLRHYTLSPFTLAQHSAVWLARCNRDGHRAVVAVSAISAAQEVSSAISTAIQFFQADRHSDRRLPLRHAQPIRRWISKIVRHPLFEIMSVVLSLGTALALIGDPPREASDVGAGDVLTRPSRIDVIVLLPFILEVVLRFVAEPDLEEYFRSGWNRLDFVVLVSMIVGFFLPRSRPLRILRVLRLLRLTLRVQALREVLEGLWSALPALMDILMLNMFVFLCFGLIGMNVLADTGASCTDRTMRTRPSCVGLFTESLHAVPPTPSLRYDAAVGVLKPRAWVQPAEVWEHIGESLLTLIIVSAFNDWHLIMFRALDSEGPGVAPSPNASWWMAVYFCVFVFFVMVLNALFVAILLEHINAKKGDAFLTKRQLVFKDTMRTLSLVNPYAMKPPKQGQTLVARIKRKCHEIATSGIKFESVVIVMIILNIIDAAARQMFSASDLPGEVVFTFALTSFIFTFFFAGELVVRMVASRSTRTFFATSGWNVFDLFLVCASLIAIPLEVLQISAFGLGQFVKVCIVLRVLRLIPRVPMLRFFSDAIVLSLPNIVNIAFVLILLIFVYQHLGLEFYSHVRSGTFTSLRLGQNFRSYWDAFLMLFVNLTLDQWNVVMADYRVYPPAGCTDTTDPSWRILSHVPWDDCGSPLWAPIFFVSFFVLGNYIFLNLVVATIVDSFISVIQPSFHEFLVPPDHLEQFQNAWLEADAVKCRGSIPLQRCVAVVYSLRTLPVVSSPATSQGELNRFSPHCPDSLLHLWSTCLQVALQLGVHRNPSWLRRLWWHVRMAFTQGGQLVQRSSRIEDAASSILGRRNHYSFSEVATSAMMLNVADSYLDPSTRHERWVILAAGYRIHSLRYAKVIISQAIHRRLHEGITADYLARSQLETTRRALKMAVIGVAALGGTLLELGEMLQTRLRIQMRGSVGKGGRLRALSAVALQPYEPRKDASESAKEVLSQYAKVVEGERSDGGDEDEGSPRSGRGGTTPPHGADKSFHGGSRGGRGAPYSPAVSNTRKNTLLGKGADTRASRMRDIVHAHDPVQPRSSEDEGSDCEASPRSGRSQASPRGVLAALRSVQSAESARLGSAASPSSKRTKTPTSRNGASSSVTALSPKGGGQRRAEGGEGSHSTFGAADIMSALAAASRGEASPSGARGVEMLNILSKTSGPRSSVDEVRDGRASVSIDDERSHTLSPAGGDAADHVGPLTTATPGAVLLSPSTLGGALHEGPPLLVPSPTLSRRPSAAFLSVDPAATGSAFVRTRSGPSAGTVEREGSPSHARLGIDRARRSGGGEVEGGGATTAARKFRPPPLSPGDVGVTSPTSGGSLSHIISPGSILSPGGILRGVSPEAAHGGGVYAAQRPGSVTGGAVMASTHTMEHAPSPSPHTISDRGASIDEGTASVAGGGGVGPGLDRPSLEVPGDGSSLRGSSRGPCVFVDDDDSDGGCGGGGRSAEARGSGGDGVMLHSLPSTPAPVSTTARDGLHTHRGAAASPAWPRGGAPVLISGRSSVELDGYHSQPACTHGGGGAVGGEREEGAAGGEKKSGGEGVSANRREHFARPRPRRPGGRWGDGDDDSDGATSPRFINVPRSPAGAPPSGWVGGGGGGRRGGVVGETDTRTPPSRHVGVPVEVGVPSYATPSSYPKPQPKPQVSLHRPTLGGAPPRLHPTPPTNAIAHGEVGGSARTRGSEVTSPTTSAVRFRPPPRAPPSVCLSSSVSDASLGGGVGYAIAPTRGRRWVDVGAVAPMELEAEDGFGGGTLPPRRGAAAWAVPQASRVSKALPGPRPSSSSGSGQK